MKILNNAFKLALLVTGIGFFIYSIVYGMNSLDSKPRKKYPIEAQYVHSIGYNIISGTIECDSIKGDTLWKDGNKIINKNIRNVTFK